jgi:SAM-dependent methyltransferase
MQDPTTPGGFDPGTYGRSFAEVYDDWYPSDASTGAAVRRIASLAGESGRVLELGVGTGRLAVPLAALGCQAHGFDASREMLDVLERKAAAHGVQIPYTLGDVADPTAWPDGPFEVIAAAFNLLFNLASADAQAACFESAAAALAPGGSFLVETFLPAPLEHRERRLEVRDVTAEGVVLIATDSDPADGVVTGQHIELVDGQPVRLRPWRIRVAGVDELDAMAAAAGLRLAERHADWSGTPFGPHGAGQVSTYRRASPA